MQLLIENKLHKFKNHSFKISQTIVHNLQLVVRKLKIKIGS